MKFARELLNNKYKLCSHSLYAHGGNGVQCCVARCKEVVLVLAHLDGVQPVADGDEERVVRHVLWGVGEAEMQGETCMQPESMCKGQG